MLKTPVRRFIFAAVLLFDLLIGMFIGLLLGTTVFARQSNTASTQNSQTHTSAADPPATVVIASSHAGFAPFIVAVQPGKSVLWQNNDSVSHTFATTPERSNFLNPQAFSLTVAAGKQVQFTFMQPGIYRYYESSVDSWNSADHRVAAKKGSANFPQAMEGIVLVKGHIAGLPTAASNSIPNGHDEFASEFIAIAPGTVSWHNFDTDTHFVSLVPGWTAQASSAQSGINPANIGVNQILGTANMPGGQTVTVHFAAVGLYYYYCAAHATIDTSTHRAKAIPMASEYPIPMEGFVLVA